MATNLELDGSSYTTAHPSYNVAISTSILPLGGAKSKLSWILRTPNNKRAIAWNSTQPVELLEKREYANCAPVLLAALTCQLANLARQRSQEQQPGVQLAYPRFSNS